MRTRDVQVAILLPLMRFTIVVHESVTKPNLALACGTSLDWSPSPFDFAPARAVGRRYVCNPALLFVRPTE